MKLGIARMEAHPVCRWLPRRDKIIKHVGHSLSWLESDAMGRTDAFAFPPVVHLSLARIRNPWLVSVLTFQNTSGFPCDGEHWLMLAPCKSIN